MHVSTLKVNVSYAEDIRVTEDTLTAELHDGRTISVPLAWYPRLVHAAQEERDNWELIGTGQGIHWPDLDEDISVEMLLAGVPSGESPQWFQALAGSQAGRPASEHLRDSACRIRRGLMQPRPPGREGVMATAKGEPIRRQSASCQRMRLEEVTEMQPGGIWHEQSLLVAVRYSRKLPDGELPVPTLHAYSNDVSRGHNCKSHLVQNAGSDELITRPPIFATDCSTIQGGGLKAGDNFMFHFLRNIQEMTRRKAARFGSTTCVILKTYAA